MIKVTINEYLEILENAVANKNSSIKLNLDIA